MAMWDPLQEIDSLRREIDRAFEEAGLGPLGGRPRLAFLPGRGARQYPLVKVYDNGQVFTVEALAPGLDPEKIDLSGFFRQFQLPDEVDTAGIQAELKNGVLTLHLPKVAPVQPRRIQVRSG